MPRYTYTHQGPARTFALLAALCGGGAYLAAEEAFFTTHSIWDDPGVVSAVVSAGVFSILAVVFTAQRVKRDWRQFTEIRSPGLVSPPPRCAQSPGEDRLENSRRGLSSAASLHRADFAWKIGLHEQCTLALLSPLVVGTTLRPRVGRPWTAPHPTRLCDPYSHFLLPIQFLILHHPHCTQRMAPRRVGSPVEYNSPRPGSR